MTENAASAPPGSEKVGRRPIDPREIIVDEVHDIAGFREMGELQAQIWRDDPGEVIPIHTFVIIEKSGGIVLGARHKGKLVGFAMGLLARRGTELYHASHIAGVHPDFQGYGIGAALKARQCEIALAQGLTLMTWTFDPLQSLNAYFNLHKLGATSRTYYEDYYGEMVDSLNRGLPSDRLLVEWNLVDTAPHETLERAAPILTGCGGEPSLQLEAAASGGAISAAIPADIAALKERSPQAALAWRLALRRALTWAFDRGYQAVDFQDGAYLLLPPTSASPFARPVS
jgi:predicted GNAT superfamily acetyltransferase